MKQKLTLLILALFTTIGGVWADTYTVTYNVGAGGSFNSSSGWCSTWVSSATPTVTIKSSGNGFNTGNGNLAQQTFTISVQSGYIITGFRISTANGWGSLVTAESGETETFTGAIEKTFSVGANAASTYFTVSASNFNKPVIDVYLADLVNYASSVIANVKPYFDKADCYFCLTSAALSTYESDYNTYKENCTEEQYNTLLSNVRALYSDPNNYVQPTTGFYRIKSSGARSIGESYIGYGSSDYGTGLRTIAAANKLTDVSTVIKLTGSNGTYKLSTQGLNVQSQTTANRSFPVTSAEGVDFVFSVIASKPGFVTICNTASENGNCHGYLHEGGDGTAAKGVVNWQAAATASQWTIEAAEDVTIPLTAANDNTSAAHTYATLCVPFEITGLTGADSKEVKAYAPAKEDNAIVPGAGASTVAAGTPVILIGEEGATSVTATIGSGYAATPATTNILTGTFTGTSIDCTADTGTNFVLGFDINNDNRIGFYHVDNASFNLKANRAYLQSEGSGVKGFVIDFDDNATGIETMINGQSSMVNEIFNLAGQRLNKMQKGINIINGKKILK